MPRLLPPWSVAVLLITGCGGGPKGDKENEVTAAIPVEVQEVGRGPIETALRTFATLEAEQEVKVFSRTANRVLELAVEEGHAVERDAVLVRLDDANQRVQVSKAENTLEKLRQEFARLEVLYGQKLISDQAYTDARFELRQTELALEDAKRELEYTVIRAPLRGVVSRRLVKLGDLVTQGQHLFDVVDFDSIVARIYIPEKNLAQLETNQTARVTATALGTREFTGKVRRIAPVVDAKSGTIKVTVGFDSVGPLRPGMYVDVELILNSKADAILVSKRALILDGDQTYAFLLKGAGKEGRTVERLLVEAVASDRLHVEPKEGFREGDRVVVAGQTGLKDGAKVRLPEDGEPETTNAPVAALSPRSAGR